MNMKSIVAVFSAAAALVAVTQSQPASAFQCLRGLQHVNQECKNGTVASGLSSSILEGITATTNKFLYKWNYTFGPTFPTASVRYVNSDGVTITNSAVTGNPCNPAVDGLKGDNVAAEKRCEVFADNLPGGASRLRVLIP